MPLPTSVRAQVLQIPATAPLIRITAGMGSVAQKTWNLRRPITLIGSRRPAHIVLHDPNICDAHCVIINTGTEVLIKDLHTESGTLCNGAHVYLAALHDGDVVQAGDTKIQVAIQKPNNPDAIDWSLTPSEQATRFDPPCILELEEVEKQWTIEEAVVLLGSHEDAGVRLDHPDVSQRHAVLFRFCRTPAVFDLGSRLGISVNDQRCSLTPLHHGDVLQVGPFHVRVGRINPQNTRVVNDPPSEGELTIAPPPTAPPAPAPQPEGTATAAMSSDLTSSWSGLNTWEMQLRDDAGEIENRRDSLASWEQALEEKEAALRGKLHDLERYNELIEQRERDVQVLAERIKEEAQQLINERIGLDKQILAAQKSEADVRRRETAIAQRWSRLKGMSCTQCGTPIKTSNIDRMLLPSN